MVTSGGSPISGGHTATPSHDLLGVEASYWEFENSAFRTAVHADRRPRGHRRDYTPEAWGNPAAHGTAVAGIIGARDPANGGVAPEVMIDNYKVVTTNRFLNGDDFAGAVAIQSAR
jgi:hypothetical protein